MPEPLKGKKFICQYGENRWDRRIVFSYEDVKSAVEWLLEEINKTDLLVLEELDFIDKYEKDPEEIVLKTLDYVKWLIKKAFEDVVG